MTVNKRRSFRMLCKALLLISLPLAGFVWALPEDATDLATVAALSLVSLAVGFGAEYLRLRLKTISRNSMPASPSMPSVAPMNSRCAMRSFARSTAS